MVATACILLRVTCVTYGTSKPTGLSLLGSLESHYLFSVLVVDKLNRWGHANVIVLRQRNAITVNQKNGKYSLVVPTKLKTSF